MNVHVVLQDLAPVATVLGAIVAGIAAWGQFKRTTVDDLKRAVEISKDLADVARQQIERQKVQITSLKSAQELQEKRLLRLEIDNARKQRILLARGQEIDMLENIVRVAVTGLRTDGGARMKVDNLLSELAKFRRRTQDQQEEWEQTQSAMHNYLTPEAIAPIDSVCSPVEGARI
jgi:delta 1-pyrroline-5-carboxylate dehydrogenase